MAATTSLIRAAVHGSSGPDAPSPAGDRARVRTLPMPDVQRRTGRGPSDGVGPVQPRLLHEHFEAQADRRPSATAVAVGRASLSYGELERLANRLARHLRARGVGRGALVAILLPRSVSAYVAVLAVLKAGGAYVALDPDAERGPLARMAEVSGSTALVSTATLAGRLAAFDGAVIRLDVDRPTIERLAARRLSSVRDRTDPSDVCCVVHPGLASPDRRGEPITHRRASRLVTSAAGLFRLTGADRLFQGAPLRSNASVLEVWLAFHYGATLVGADARMQAAGPHLGRMLSTAGVTVLPCTPTVLARSADDIPTVRMLILRDEASPARLLRHWVHPLRHGE